MKGLSHEFLLRAGGSVVVGDKLLHSSGKEFVVKGELHAIEINKKLGGGSTRDYSIVEFAPRRHSTDVMYHIPLSFPILYLNKDGVLLEDDVIPPRNKGFSWIPNIKTLMERQNKQTNK